MREKVKASTVKVKSGGQSGAVYAFGMIGALIYYIQIADGFWRVVLAFLKAVVWPAFFTYDVLKYIGAS
jgi:hypothetical protein